MSKARIPQHALKEIPIDQLLTLKRNPQYQTPHQQRALTRSIERDGFWAPVLVRKLKGNRYEIVSGNHRVAAAREAGLKTVACVVAKLSDQQALRVAINANTIHGDPAIELLAPFLADLDAETLGTVHLSEAMIAEIKKFDATLAATLKENEAMAAMDRPSDGKTIPDCRCEKCGRLHVSK